MKRLHRSSDRMFVQMLTDRLQAEGIDCVVKDENRSSMGEITPIVSWATVWVIESEHYDRAEELLHAITNLPSLDEATWECSQCGEVHEPQFSTCWNCGNDKEAV